ncbi:MAG: hypothetical protein LUI60_08040 [Clostridia bacterium]|nr:hypothetical protein [Clostridia bacterium]
MKDGCRKCFAELLDDIDFIDAIPEFLEDATNIYRTKDYIVCQYVSMQCRDNQNMVVSYDTYYRRTEKRDAQYEILFEDRRNLDGKRMAVSMYTRTYID